MVRHLRQLVVLLSAMACFCTLASADTVAVGLLSYDAISPIQDQFDITNLTGLAALPPDEPITTPLTFTVSSLVVNFTSGPSLTIPGFDFTIVDTDGDVNCTVLSTCNLSGDSITSAILTGTLSPTTGLKGLPPGATGIEAGFTTTITPNPVVCTGGTLEAGCDAATIFATTTTHVIPEPGTVALVGIGMVGLLLIGCRRLRGAGVGRASSGAA
jgi:hypothetical protein